ncbi:hypothetical protein, partial [Cupriavidus oxalaticus]|uniref:hypothetical protein n=1 Tax=Cupriavidus oxalaticus TaxID=96344 RepID=UPI00316D3091
MDGRIEVVSDGQDGSWAVQQTITTAANPFGDGPLGGMPFQLTAPGDLDGDGISEVVVDWFVGSNGHFSTLYRMDETSATPQLIEIGIDHSGMSQPIGDYSITYVNDGQVTTEVEDCTNSCASGETYPVIWSYDATTDTLHVTE